MPRAAGELQHGTVLREALEGVDRGNEHLGRELLRRIRVVPRGGVVVPNLTARHAGSVPSQAPSGPPGFVGGRCSG